MSKYKRSEDTHELKVHFRDGSVDTLQVREMTEEDSRKRQNVVIGAMGRRGNNAAGGRSIRLDKQRDFDFKHSIVSWQDERGSEVDFKAPGFIEDLPMYITEQISTFIQELNAQPEDEYEEDEDTGEEVVKEENPTSASFAPSVVSG